MVIINESALRKRICTTQTMYGDVRKCIHHFGRKGGETSESYTIKKIFKNLLHFRFYSFKIITNVR